MPRAVFARYPDPSCCGNDAKSSTETNILQRWSRAISACNSYLVLGDGQRHLLKGYFPENAAVNHSVSSALSQFQTPSGCPTTLTGGQRPEQPTPIRGSDPVEPKNISIPAQGSGGSSLVVGVCIVGVLLGICLGLGVLSGMVLAKRGFTLRRFNIIPRNSELSLICPEVLMEDVAKEDEPQMFTTPRSPQAARRTNELPVFSSQNFRYLRESSGPGRIEGGRDRGVPFALACICTPVVGSEPLHIGGLCAE